MARSGNAIDLSYDVPEAPEDNVHHIGRAGNKGKGITFFTLAEEHSLRAIEKLMGQLVERVVRPDMGAPLSRI